MPRSSEVPLPLARLLPLLVLVVAACRSSGESAEPAAAPSHATHSHTLVLLKAGPRREPMSDAEQSKVMGGHAGARQRLAREGHLLVAGPYGKKKSDPMLRGLYVFETGDRGRAKELAETDPGFQAGVFAFEYHAISTDAPFRRYIDAELAADSGMRNYVVVTIENGTAAAQLLGQHSATLFFATLDETRALVLLDAKDEPAARALLEPMAAKLGAFRLDEWMSASRLATLPKLPRD